EVRVEYLEQGGGIRGGSGVSGGEEEGDATDGAGSGGGQGAQGGSGFSVDGGVPSSAPSIGGALSGSRTGTPADIVPPFPFKSLILSFAFLIPMNFVIQAHSSSFMDERVNRRGELLLVSPVSRFDIIVGKTLPYFGLLLGVTVLIALGIGGGFVSVASVVPVALVFLATSFVGAMFARSFKELTFVMVSSSVLLTSYVFVPAMFTAVERISSISPITLVVNELQGTGVGWTDYAFATLPLYLTALVLFGLGAGVYKEEDMFTQRRLPHKALDSVANWLRRASVAKVTAFLIPLVFAAELLALALLFAVPIGVSIPVILVTVSLIEEVAKSVAVYAGFAKSVFERTT
ncbi:MAG: PrsW family intramembrane metalloprotease, partial [Halobacteria archaeon]|nr:PrsW family intramembrane metalloprotease [Halobacteria archaeon]